MKVIKILDFNPETDLKIDLHYSVQAGLPTTTYDYKEPLDLNKHLIRNPKATYFVKVSGDSMIDAGINDNGILIIDCALEWKSGDIIIARLNEELTVKRYVEREGERYLVAENSAYDDILITPETEFQVLGVAIHVIHSLQKFKNLM